MRLSEDKITHISHLILEGLKKDPRVAIPSGEETALREIKRTIVRELQIDEEVDQAVRAKLASYSRPLPDGSPEWDVLYRKFFNEEMKNRNR